MEEATGDERVIEVGPDDADAAVILLHGLGDSGEGLAGLAPHLDLGGNTRVRLLFPDAPVRPVTLNAGMAMRAWYDIDPAAGPDSGSAEIRASADIADALVARECERGLEPGRIVLGGFSQGGVIALEAALGSSRKLAGVIALSTYLHDAQRADERVGLANAGASIFMAHGSGDPMIPLARAATSRDRLEELGYAVEWHEYPMGHEVCMPEIQALSDWLRRHLPARS